MKPIRWINYILNRSFSSWCLANGFQPWSSSLWIQCDQRIDSRKFLGWKVIPNFISTVARQSLESRPVRGSLHAASRSLPLGLPTPAAASVSILVALPPLQPLLVCPAAFQLCHCVTQSNGQSSFYRVNNNIYCPHMCSELGSYSLVRILATGTFTLSKFVLGFPWSESISV